MLQHAGAGGGHQQVVSGADNQRRAGDGAHAWRAKISLLQGLQPLQQILFALKMGRCASASSASRRGSARGHPVRRVEEQRLRFDPRLRAAGMQQTLAHLEAAAGMRRSATASR